MITAGQTNPEKHMNNSERLVLHLFLINFYDAKTVYISVNNAQPESKVHEALDKLYDLSIWLSLQGIKHSTYQRESRQGHDHMREIDTIIVQSYLI